MQGFGGDLSLGFIVFLPLQADNRAGSNVFRSLPLGSYIVKTRPSVSHQCNDVHQLARKFCSFSSGLLEQARCPSDVIEPFSDSVLDCKIPGTCLGGCTRANKGTSKKLKACNLQATKEDLCSALRQTFCL